MDIYKKEFQNVGGYLVNMEKVDDEKGGYIKLSRVERFILAVGAYEERIFGKRTQIRDKTPSRIEKNNLEEGASSESEIVGMHSIAGIDVVENTKELKQKLKEKLRNISDLTKHGCFGTDEVKFGTPGWRERYYKENFGAETTTEMELMRESVVGKYVEGLCWVLQCYFSEVPSWSWFYPFDYGPFASDIRGISQLEVRFQKGLPFKPFEQLMAVLPPRSYQALPLAYRRLMVEEDSKIIYFYPTEFEVDIDGKKLLWQGICKLPIIDEDVENQLKMKCSDEENIRNEPTPHQLFLTRSSKFRKQLLSCRETKNSESIKGAIAIESEIRGLKGTIHVMCEDLTGTDDDNSTDMYMYYEIPQCFRNIPRLLEGINFPEKTIKRDDLEETVLWHEHHRKGAMRNNYSHRSYQKPDTVLKRTGNGKGCSSGRGKASIPQENQNDKSDGLFKPSYRRHDYGGNQGLQMLGSNYHGKSTYRPYDSNFWSSGSGESEDWRVNKSFAPNVGRGEGRG